MLCNNVTIVKLRVLNYCGVHSISGDEQKPRVTITTAMPRLD